MPAARIFRHSIRVPYAHTDQMRVVYYSRYFEYFEMARSEMLREIGLPYCELEQRGVLLPVVEAFCQYKLAARFDDLLIVSSRCQLRGPRLRVDYEMHRGSELIATGYTVHVCLTAAGNVIRPIPELRQLLEASRTA